MGACSFIEFQAGHDARSAFNERYAELEEYYGCDPYNGTMSTCELDLSDGVPQLAPVFNPDTAEDAACQFARQNNYGEKWYAKPIDLGEMPDGSGMHMFAFYGLAAE